MSARGDRSPSESVQNRGTDAEDGGFARSAFVGGQLGTRRIVILIVAFPALFTADSVVDAVTHEPGLTPGLAPLMLGCLLTVVSHAFDSERRAERRTAQVVGNLVSAVGVVLVLMHWFGP